MDTDQTLVERAKQGDDEAFAQLVERNQGRIYNLALRMTGSPEDAAELAQEAFLNAWRGLERFHGESAFSTWLYRLASNACIDFLRREKRRRNLSMTISLEDEEGERQAELPGRGEGPEERMERLERAAAIRQGLDSLSSQHRQVLVLREMEGLSYGEIAALLCIEEGTVKSRIARARLALRKYLIATGNFSDRAASM